MLTKTNPITGEILWQGEETTPLEVNDLCMKSRQAFIDWAKKPFGQREEIIIKFGELLTENKSKLAKTISLETSKPLWETITEVQSMIGKIAISIKAYHERTGQSSNNIPGATAGLRHKPHGVLAVIGPYNFPGHLPNGHIVPALLAGNCVIFKPSELTPLTAEHTMELWKQAGIPEGVLTLVQGGKDTGIALTSNEMIDGILFTGSANTGFQLHKQLAQKPAKILALEMGGNNALIIDQIDDMNAVINLAIQSAFISAGQRCTCARRILVVKGDKGDEFIERLIKAAKNLRIGKYDENPEPFMGGVISSTAAKNLILAQEKLIKLEAKPLLLMTQPNLQSSIVTPGIIDITGIDDLPDEEYFGPLTQIIRYETFDEAIKIVNNTKFGLAVGLVSPDRNLFDQLLIESNAGIVNWNKPLTGASSAAPFGGVGASGNHRPSAYYAADYCAWPVASLESETVELPAVLSPGIILEANNG